MNEIVLKTIMVRKSIVNDIEFFKLEIKRKRSA